MTKTQKKLTLFALTWPIFIELGLRMLMGNADTLMLSRYSDDAVAAVGVANQLVSVLLVMFGFVAMGTGIVVSQYLGAGEKRKASEVAVVALGANLLFGLFLSLMMIVFGRTFLQWMGLPDELMSDALTFLRIVGGAAVLQAVMMAISATVRSHGFAKDAMYVTLGMNVLNVIGNYLFIFGPFGLPVLGVLGVSMSTAIAQVCGLIVMFVILVKRMDGALPFKLLLKFPRYALVNILKIGVPSAGEHLSYMSSQVMITFLITMIGIGALTTKVYTQNLMMFIYLFSMAIAQGTQILIGHLVGAREQETAYRTCLKSLKIGIMVSLGMACVMSLFRENMLGLFTDDADIVALGSTLILMTILLEPGRVFNLVVISSLRAAGDAKFPVYLGILSMWGVSVPLAYLLGIYLGYGLVGVWAAFIVDEWLRGLLMLWRWRTKRWQQMSLVQSVQAPVQEGAAG
ncbi:MATE family efflux transporter [Tumebacillus avium]|uniref:MATE family efflux transporter n=1 Tax=Tumebacillus avium TaxID=1903704 RepID=A0A1Y0IHE2_9BACL|nr:MATE family efflux transporter [Tumebacillus avium]ARU59901.1 MATE family efflux transporter [Tumebacillus avium]